MALEELQKEYLKGISIVLGNTPNDKREGWFDVQNNAVVINVGHPIHIQFETSRIALQYHYARVVAFVLVHHISTQKSMTIQESTELQTEILTKVLNELWL